jgi:predicted TPR repeat methyltransferase
MIADSRYAYARAAAAQEDWRAAADVLEQALERAPHWATAWFALGEARSKLGEQEYSAAAFNAALAADPTDTLGASNRLALLRDGAAQGLPRAYVARLFDDYAPRFDEHLMGRLNYRGPELLAEALAETAKGRRFAICLDLGCGTGLAGAAARGRIDNLIGVDLSAAMIARAREKQIYDALEVNDLVDFLDARAAGAADLALAADVLAYCGDPGAIFARVKRALKPGGLFALTVETHTESGVRFNDRLRFAHAPDSLVEMAMREGLSARLISDVSVRREAGKAVEGLIGVFVRV